MTYSNLRDEPESIFGRSFQPKPEIDDFGFRRIEPADKQFAVSENPVADELVGSSIPVAPVDYPSAVIQTELPKSTSSDKSSHFENGSSKPAINQNMSSPKQATAQPTAHKPTRPSQQSSISKHTEATRPAVQNMHKRQEFSKPAPVIFKLAAPESGVKKALTSNLDLRSFKPSNEGTVLGQFSIY